MSLFFIFYPHSILIVTIFSFIACKKFKILQSLICPCIKLGLLLNLFKVPDINIQLILLFCLFLQRIAILFDNSWLPNFKSTLDQFLQILIPFVYADWRRFAILLLLLDLIDWCPVLDADLNCKCVYFVVLLNDKFAITVAPVITFNNFFSILII